VFKVVEICTDLVFTIRIIITINGIYDISNRAHPLKKNLTEHIFKACFVLNICFTNSAQQNANKTTQGSNTSKKHKHELVGFLYSLTGENVNMLEKGDKTRI